MIQRSSGVSVTEFLRVDDDSPLTWDEAWPEVEARVRRTLQRRGAPESTIDDALQTAALRALQRPDGFDCVAGFVTWVTKVAWHAVQAEWHRQARNVSGEMPELADHHDPDRVFMGRRDLEAVKRSLDQLSYGERAAILSALDDHVYGVTPLTGKLKMRRRRARQRLTALLEDSSDRDPMR